MKQRWICLSLCMLTALTAFCQSWKEYADSAKYLTGQKNNAAALAHYVQAVRLLARDSAGTLTQVLINNDLGDCYVALGKYADAEPCYVLARSAIVKLSGKENATYALVINNLGRLQRLLGKYEDSEKSLLEAKGVRETLFGKENADYATTCNLLAILYAEVGQYDDAGPLYMEAKEIRARVLGKNHLDYAASCNNVGIYYVLTGKPAEAERYYLEAMQIRERLLGKDHPVYAASCNNIAALYMDLGLYSKAEPLYLEAKSIRERTLGPMHPEYAVSCNNLAILYMDLGYYQSAEALYSEAKTIYEKTLGKEHIEYGKSCNNLALLYKQLAQYERARALFAEAKTIFFNAVGRDHFEYGKCCNNLGAVYMDLHDYKRADTLYREAKSVWETVFSGEHPEYAKACHNIGLIQMQLGNYTEAEKWLLDANRIREKTLGVNHVDYAEGCDNLGQLYLLMKNYARAEELSITAKQIRSTILGSSHPDYLQSCINLARVYIAQKKNAMAINLYTEAFSSQQALLGKIFRFSTEPEKQAYLRKVNEYRDHFLSFISTVPFDNGAVYAYEVSLANKNLIVNSNERLRYLIAMQHDTALTATYNNWMRLREQLAFWYVKPVAQRKVILSQLEEQADQLEKQLITFTTPQDTVIENVSWKKVQESLRMNEAAVEFSSFHPLKEGIPADRVQYFAIVIRKDRSTPELVMLADSDNLGSALGNRSGSPGPQRLNYLYRYRSGNGKNQSLYQLLWEPLQAKLGSISTVYFSATGELHRIAFAAIPIDAKLSLGERYHLVQLNTTASIPHIRPAYVTSTTSFILYGGVQYSVDSANMRKAAMLTSPPQVVALRAEQPGIVLPGASEFTYLGQTEKEVNAIAAMAATKGFPTTLLTGINATEESIKHIPNSSDSTILHIATHGFFFPDRLPDTATSVFSTGGAVLQHSDNPLIRSGLALAGANNAWKGKAIAGIEDGILTAYEVSNLYIPRVKLAVLSACETGLGDIQGSEGVYGLQRAFRIAGVQYLIMSLWRVPDAETAEFMKEFYTNLFATMPITDAFTHAQMTMKSRYKNDPFKWAAWVLVR